VRTRGSAAVLAAAALLAGCSSGTSEPAAQETQAADVGWNPCDGLTASAVGRIAGARVTEETGTTDRPRCTFVPVDKGGPAYDVSYLWFDGGLDRALDSMGAVATQLRRVEVAGADAARIAVRERRTGILVTGFVQTNGLVQSVNAVQLKPYDKGAMVQSTTDLLTDLARSAPDPS
jgi:Protein of unknown function (DUF3558)